MSKVNQVFLCDKVLPSNKELALYAVYVLYKHSNGLELMQLQHLGGYRCWLPWYC